ncbi:superoxide dismutase family protein [Deinococcus fonticola]|uniref:superoxide dismutase family protein n=1 Tax=Deinococcus fonticola TaxID=2528713 RepID=UPI001074F1B8|nr:superoxide dismutase family protein [Deinococcus fonticola]
MKQGLTLTALALTATLASCTMMTGPRATANLLDPNDKAVGSVTFTREGGGTRVKVSVSGLAPGQHGMHIHMNASCSNSTDASGNTVIFGGAGGHFDPSNAMKHASPETPNTAGHGGDIPMITVNSDGVGSADFLTTKVSLSGPDSVMGRSIVIHAAADDYKTDPAGNSGARLVCGVINQG